MRKRSELNREMAGIRVLGPMVVLAALAMPAAAAAQAVPPGQPRPEELAEVRTDSLAEPPLPAFDWDILDPRVNLASGWLDAESAIWNLELVAATPRPEGFFNPETPRQGAGFSNTDLAFQGNYLFQGNYNGFQVYDISDPSNIELHVAVVCPGGQGDVSIYGDLLFMSAQETRGRLDCGTEGVQDSVSVERFRGVRIFDLSNLEAPRQVAAVQTCRGSHTHTVVTDPGDDDNVYVYVSGTSGVRPADELPGCSGLPPEEDANTAYFRIEVIQVPLANPEDARIVNMPRIFADPETGEYGGLWQGGDHGEGTQDSRLTNQCHDITAFPEIGLAAGACAGNGILLDISDPANPARLDEVVDPNFAYWHSATFNNDGTKILFTDEWGGGSQPRCRSTDPPDWGANAIFNIVDGQMELAGYYKLPVPQSEVENCVAHNGAIIPVPGRDIMVQAWYQGGLSMLDFTDSSDPVEIAFFDRGPLTDDELITGGYWSTYWNNGFIYGAEITRGLDIFRLEPSEHLSQHEIDAANMVQVEEFNAQLQPMFNWPAHPAVAGSYLDQLERAGDIQPSLLQRSRDALAAAESMPGADAAAQLRETAAALDANAAEVNAGERLGDATRQRWLAQAMRELAASMD